MQISDIREYIYRSGESVREEIFNQDPEAGRGRQRANRATRNFRTSMKKQNLYM